MKQNFTFHRYRKTGDHWHYLENFWISRTYNDDDASWFKLDAWFDSEWTGYRQQTGMGTGKVLITLICSGCMESINRAGMKCYKAHDLLISIPDKSVPKTSGSYSGAKGKAPLLRLGLLLRPAPELLLFLHSISERNSFCIHCKDHDLIKDIFFALKKEITKHNGRSRELERLLLDLLKAIKREKESEYIPLELRKCLDYIAEQGGRNIANAELAGAAGISERKLLTLFQKSLGTSPGEYLIRKRIQQAQTLLRSGRFLVYEAACQSGFASVQYFCRQFKQRTGMTPNEYLKASFLTPEKR